MVAIPIPFFKLGIANVITLLVLAWYGIRETLTVVVLRVLVGSMLIGTLFQPNFFFSMAGGLSSAVVMGLTLKYGHRFLGLIGISILGAFTKNATQLCVAYLVWVRQIRIWSLLPLFFLISIIAGTLVGLLTSALLKKIRTPAYYHEQSRS
jgi:heptaprenyl diphosphate synthase